MTTSKGSAFGPIDPSLAYTLPQMAAALDMTPRAFRDNFIRSGKLRFLEYTKGKYLITGESLVSFLFENMDTVDTEEEECNAK